MIHLLLSFVIGGHLFYPHTHTASLVPLIYICWCYIWVITPTTLSIWWSHMWYIHCSRCHLLTGIDTFDDIYLLLLTPILITVMLLLLTTDTQFVDPIDPFLDVLTRIRWPFIIHWRVMTLTLMTVTVTCLQFWPHSRPVFGSDIYLFVPVDVNCLLIVGVPRWPDDTFAFHWHLTDLFHVCLLCSVDCWWLTSVCIYWYWPVLLLLMTGMILLLSQYWNDIVVCVDIWYYRWNVIVSCYLSYCVLSYLLYWLTPLLTIHWYWRPFVLSLTAPMTPLETDCMAHSSYCHCWYSWYLMTSPRYLSILLHLINSTTLIWPPNQVAFICDICLLLVCYAEFFQIHC